MSATAPASDRPVALVTGASAGVGRATAVALGRAGYDVALLARGRAGLLAAAEEVRATGARAHVVQADVADAAAVARAAGEAEAALGPLDAWINSAMTTVFGQHGDIDPAEIRRTTEVTYLGQVHGTLTALARMEARGRGRIVNVGSALAYVGIPLQAAYCGAKFACRGFTESVRAELVAADSPVTLSMVHLPAVDTPQFDWCESKMDRQARPVAPVYTPDQAADAIVAALDGRRSGILGAWNRAIIAMSGLAPGVVAQFAAASAVDGQQTEDPQPADAPSNLWDPVDGDEDRGATGRFGDESRGVLDPAFLRQVPETARTLVQSVAAAWADRLRSR